MGSKSQQQVQATPSATAALLVVMYIAAFVAAFALLIVTGWLKTLKNLTGFDLPDPILFWLAQLHNAGMVLAILLFFGHMAAFIFKANRHLIPAMFSGFVDADYAKHRHALWKPEEEKR